MRKKYVILLYVIFIILASIGVSSIVWQDLKGNTISNQYYESYNNYKNALIEKNEYINSIDELDIEVNVYESNSSYLISTKFSNPDSNYKDLKILVIDESELITKTNKVYPSVGIVGNFENEFVTSSPNKKTTHSSLTLNYESERVSEGVLIYFEYNDSGKQCIVYLNIEAQLNIN